MAESLPPAIRENLRVLLPHETEAQVLPRFSKRPSPEACFAIAGYLSFAALALAENVPPFRDEFALHLWLIEAGLGDSFVRPKFTWPSIPPDPDVRK